MPEIQNNWLHASVLNGRETQYVDVSEIGLPDGNGGVVQKLPCVPLTVSEYNVLKSHPRCRSLNNSNDRNEVLGMLAVFRCLEKADPTLKETDYFNLPLGTLGKIAEAVTKVLGTGPQASGGGVLGELKDGAEQTKE